MSKYWRKTSETLPPNDVQRVLAVVVYPHGKRDIVLAEYVHRRKVYAWDYLHEDTSDDFIDYDSENDVEYAPAGFYEVPVCAEGWSAFITDTVTHWAPLPALPD